MKFSAKDLEDNAVELTIEIPVADVAKGEKKALKQITEKLNIPGFRKGKAPKDVVVRHVGKEYVIQSAFDLLYPKALNEALDEGKYKPVSRVEVDPVTVESGKDIVFKANFTDHPEVTLGEYKGLDIKKPEVNITDEDVEKETENLLYSHSELTDAKEGEVTALGDLVTLDFEGFKDGEPFEGGKAQDYILELGNNEFIDNFEEQLVGLKAGEAKDVNVTFPEDYRDESLAGKPALFKCVIKSFKKRTYPELTDEFVQEKVDKKFSTVAELKESIKTSLTAAAERDANNAWINSAVEKAAENITVTIPEVMVEDELDSIMKTLELRLKEQNVDVESYFSMLGTDIGQYREGQREQAEKNVRINLMLEAVAEKEKIEVTPQDLSTEILTMAMAYRVSPREITDIIKKQGQVAQQNLNFTALRKKVAQFIFHTLPGNEKTEDKAAQPSEEAAKTE